MTHLSCGVRNYSEIPDLLRSDDSETSYAIVHLPEGGLIVRIASDVAWE